MTGYIDSDGFERVLIRNDSCAKFGLILGYSTIGAKSSGAKKIKEAVFYTPPWGTDYKDIRATFVGHFIWQPATADRNSTMRLIVDEVDNLRMVRLKHKRLSPYPELR